MLVLIDGKLTQESSNILYTLLRNDAVTRSETLNGVCSGTRGLLAKLNILQVEDNLSIYLVTLV